MEVKIQKLRPGAVTPRRGSADAAGYDLYACPADGQCVTIAPHATAMIGTGLALAIPAGYFGGVFARSGLASKQGLRPAPSRCTTTRTKCAPSRPATASPSS